MRIGFDARYAEGDLVGVGKYIQSLVLNVSKLGFECVLFYSQKPKYKIIGENISSLVLQSNNRYVFEQINIPLALIRGNIDLYHATGNIGIPIFCPVPSILTIHDIIPITVKNYFSYSLSPIISQLSYFIRLETSIFKSTKIVAVSNFVKDEVVKKLGVGKNKIFAIHSGVPSIAKAGILPNGLKKTKYILNNGGIDIRKNIDTLIYAFCLVHKKFSKLKLVVTGENLRIKKQLENLVKKLKLTDSVVFTGYIDNPTLSALIKSAELICYPTHSEGFGFPVLEGFSHGVPVVSSNTSAIPEIAGNAAILIDPNNKVEIAQAITKVLESNKLKNELIKRGKKRIKDFDWNKSANEYVNLYNIFR